jgi:4-nitrophenyl phosphatase
MPAGQSIYPATGSILASLTAPLARTPTIIGKPNQVMMDLIVQKYSLNRQRTLMVGDRLDTDILFGQRGQVKTMLVLSGVTKIGDLENINVKPDYIFESLSGLFPN